MAGVPDARAGARARDVRHPVRTRSRRPAISKLWIPLVTLLVIAVVGGVFLIIGGIEGDDADTGPEEQPTRSVTE